MPKQPNVSLKVTLLVASPGKNRVHEVELNQGETVRDLLERMLEAKEITQEERERMTYIDGEWAHPAKSIIVPGTTLVVTSRQPANVMLTIDAEARQTFILPLHIGTATTPTSLLEQAQADQMVYGLKVSGGMVEQLNGRSNGSSGRWLVKADKLSPEGGSFLTEGSQVHWQYRS